MPTTVQQLGALIRKRRQELHLTQQALARKAGTHQSSVGQWELGRQVPSPEQLARLASALALPLPLLQAAEAPRRGRRGDWLPRRYTRLHP
jgi:transcriptional regulator with XRE-family HTH domain